MKLKGLFCVVFAVIIITGCSKNEVITPDPPTVTGPQKSFSLANVLQSNMVIQRDKPFRVWGYGPVASNVNITVSWDKNTYQATTNAGGVWEAIIPAAPVNTSPQKLTVATAGKQPMVLDNILIGDVWVCAGQSNMAMPLGNIAPFTGVENYQSEIAAANYPQIRSLTVAEDYEDRPAEDLNHAVKWNTCSPANAANLSAVAYYFARTIHTQANVPVGIIISAVNGSWCETWTNKEAIQADGLLNSLYANVNQSSKLFNGMINPLKTLSIKGFIWYQGENNQKTVPQENYTRLNSALIKGWRSVFNQGELPFYFVQLTPFDDGATGNVLLNWFAKFREAQANIRTTPGTGMAVTMDAGEVSNHHPKYKKPVGERLAFLALNKVYGENVPCIGPQYASFTQSGSSVNISFKPGTSTGLGTINNAPLNQYFFVAGTDHVFRQGQAKINGDKINIIIPANMPLPVMAVRYAFTNFPVTNLQNAAGLPMEPFRTDNWDN